MATVGALNSFFTSLISDLMLLERQPLQRLQKQRDSISARSGAYGEMDSKLNELQDAVQVLTSTGLSSALTAGRMQAVSNVATGYTVLSASVSGTAIPGTYQISVSELAREHRLRSDKQVYSDQALGLSGVILAGGASARSVATNSTIANTVTAFGTANPGSAQPELGSSTYFVETRQDAALGWQFRLVDPYGSAVAILDGSGESYSSNWQSIPVGTTYDTGRGLTITFGGDSGSFVAASRGAGAAEIGYTPQGTTITITTSDSLNTLASKFNAAAFPAGDGILATVVDGQLVLAAEQSGLGNTIVLSDQSGTVLQTLGVLTGAGTYKNEIQTPLDASFTVNGISVTRPRNSGLADVINGVTLNLAPDAKDRSATLTVSEDWSGTLSAVDTFIATFNSVLEYIESKTAISELSGGETPTYSRGLLADESIFNELRGDLFSIFISRYASGGIYASLREVGITIGDDLRATVSDRTALEAALAEHYDDLVGLLDTVMNTFDAKLGRFTGETGTTGYLDSVVANYSSQLQDINGQIDGMNVYLVEREAYLTNQYAEMQALLLSMSYTQQMWSNIYGSVNSYS